MLTERQQRFVDCYRGNGLEAARAAGYTGTDATVKVAASKLRRHPDASAALEDRRARITADVGDEPTLAPKHRAFVDAFVQLGNAAGAARDAGYAPSSAAMLLKRADVREAIKRASARAQREAADIAQGRELQVLLTELARSPRVEPKDRIRAIAALHKIQKGLLPAGAAGVSRSETSRRPRLMIVRNGRGPASNDG